MKANFSQILHQMRFKLLKSTTPAHYTLPPALPNSEKLSKISLLKRKIQAIYKSRSEAIKWLVEDLLLPGTQTGISNNRDRQTNNSQSQIEISEIINSHSFDLANITNSNTNYVKFVKFAVAYL